MPSSTIDKRKQINLLSQDFVRPEKYKNLPKVSYFVIGIYIFLIILLFGTTIFLNYQKKSLSKIEDSLLQELQSQNETIELYSLLKSRLQAAQGVFSKTSAPIDLTNKTISILPFEVELSNVEVDKEGKIVFVAKTDSSFAVGAFLANLKTSNYKSVFVNTLALSSDGKYVISVDISQ